MLELPRGKIDGDRCALPTLIQPRAGLRARGLNHLLSHPDDQPRLLGHFEKGHRKELAASGMLPSHQRFHGRDLLLCHAEDRLIAHEKLGALDRSMQLHLHRKTLHRPLIDAAVVQVPAVSAEAFAGARGCVGGSEKASHLATILRENGDADARSDEQLLFRGRQRLIDFVLQELGDSHSVLDVPQVRSDENELIAAEPRESVRRADARGKPAADRPQHFIARVVTERVVDSAETVHINVEQRQLRPQPPRLRQRDRQAIFEQPPVGKRCQAVVIRLMLESDLNAPSLGDVVPRPHKSGQRSLGRMHSVHGRFDPYGFAHCSLQPVRDCACGPALHDRPLQRCGLVKVFFAHQRLQRRADQLIRLPASEDDDLRRNVRQDPAIVCRPIDIRCPFSKEAKKIVRRSMHHEWPYLLIRISAFVGRL